jgi:hypothetical protein
LEVAVKVTSVLASLAVALTTASAVHAQTNPQVPYPVRAFTPAHGDLAGSHGVPAQLANEEYVEALARIVYYWGYPAVDGPACRAQREHLQERVFGIARDL